MLGPKQLAAQAEARAKAHRDASRVGEELWVIQKPVSVAAADPAAREAAPRSGCLITQDPTSNQTLPIPLKHTDVKASVAGYIASVNVTQQFQNPFSGKIEAVYVFPLPENAAINEFVMTIGDRKIRGIIRERQEAERIYVEARNQGHVASLLTQERPNIFTQKVANIEPGKAIDIDITYFSTLSYVDGWYEFVFPMVVGPRFNPPGSMDGIGAVGVGARGTSGQKTEIQYLTPDKRSGHDISLAVDLTPGVRVEKVESNTHSIRVAKNEAAGTARVELDRSDSIPNKDFVLRYKLAGNDVKPGLLVHRDARGEGYFTLMLFPPEDISNLARSPVEMFFTLDVSGSMSGAPLEQSKAAMRYALTHMRPMDTFQVITFAGNAETMSAKPLPATGKNLTDAIQFMDSSRAGGGTMMMEGIKASLQTPTDESRPRFVAFLTDGFIGNEAEILRGLHDSLGDSKVFSFGVGSSTNRYLMDSMAKVGRGAVAYLGLQDDGEKVMKQYFDRISHPALTNVKIDWGGMEVTDVYPRQLPDLYVGRPVILTGRFKGDKDTVVKVSGNAGGQVRQFEVNVRPSDDGIVHPALPAVWARMKIADLADQSTYDANPKLPEMVKQVALDHGLMSSYTAFLAVDSMTKTAGEFGTTVAVPVAMPEGVRYDTTVNEGQPAGARTAAANRIDD